MAGEPSDSDFFADAIGGLEGRTPDDKITIVPDRGGGDQGSGERVDERGFRHDERGRYAGRADQQGDQPRQGQDEGGDDQGGPEGIPSWRIREINAERREAISQAETLRRENEDFRRRLASIEQREQETARQRQPPARPDPLREPEQFNGYIDERFQTVEEKAQEIVDRRMVNGTFAEMHEQFGTEFENAYMAAREAVAEGNTQLFEDFKAAYHPGKALMNWWKREKGYREVGDDLDAYNARQRDSLLKDEQFREKALQEWGFTGGGGGQMTRRDSGRSSGRDSATVIQLPSVNQASGSGGGGNRPGALPVTDRDFFNDAVGGLPTSRAQRARRGA